jgi:hypothetical protein
VKSPALPVNVFGGKYEIRNIALLELSGQIFLLDSLGEQSYSPNHIRRMSQWVIMPRFSPGRWIC